MRDPNNRRVLAAVLAASVASAGLSLGLAGSAHAADSDDPTFVPAAADLVGVGSATSQHALHVRAEGAGSWSAQVPAPAFKIASFAATGGGTIAVPGAAVTRPNGSTEGKALLATNANVDFARSSSAQSPAETAAGLQSIPFAVDKIALAVSAAVPSNAPANLTPAQIVGIYNGTIKDWKDIDPTKSGTIAPKIPQAGSGTREFFLQQLQAMNGGVAVTLGASVLPIQEQDATAVRSDPNAIVPFSVGRATLLGAGNLRIETGWQADRALYNVVRGADLNRADIQAAFGPSGFLCSIAARSLIESAGFKQLANAARGGVCGAATQAATTNFTLNQAVATTTTLTGTSVAANKAALVAKVTGATVPVGRVSFYDGTRLVAAGVPLINGQATRNVWNLTPGSHSFKAVFVPASAAQFDTSQATGTVSVLAASAIRETFVEKVRLKRAKQKVTGKIQVRLLGSATKPTGQLLLRLGNSRIGVLNLVDGVASYSIRVNRLKFGRNHFRAVWAGDANAAGSALSFAIKRIR